MNYKIILNTEKLQEFVDWLPELLPTEQYYFALFARKKYDTSGLLTADKSQIKSFTSTKERIIDKIKKLEVELGSYVFNQQPIPENTLALYVSMPRCMKKATVSTLKQLADNLGTENYKNPYTVALSCIQTAKGKTRYIDFDIDTDPQENIEEIISPYINIEATTVIKTRGGYHVLVDPEKVSIQYKNSFYRELSVEADQHGDLLLPVVGCRQGDFEPKLIKL